MDFPVPNNGTDLTGRVALVTGASSGLGSRFARVLAFQGAKVVLAARRKEHLDALADEIGDSALAVEMDANLAESLIATVDAAESAFGPVNVLINNAVIPDAQLAHKMSVELVDQVLGVKPARFLAPGHRSCKTIDRRAVAWTHC